MKHSRLRGRILALLLNALATIQLVWFYLRVPSALNLAAYEQGRERTPFQQRLLWMLPMRWARASTLLNHVASALTLRPGWFPIPAGAWIHPEAVLQAVIDIASVVVTGLIARRLYLFSSQTWSQYGTSSSLLTPFVYPLTLLMIAVTYTTQVSHQLRFVYDLPAMAFSASGLYLILCRSNPFAFVALFLVATLNRETTLLLLPVYWITQVIPWRASSKQSALRLLKTRQPGPSRYVWKNLYAPRTLIVVLPLCACWLFWHSWSTARFAGNPSASAPRLLLNLGTLLSPAAWPQLASAAAFLWPLPILYRRAIADATLRAWTLLPLFWLLFMLKYGLLIETRIFGELIPYYAVTVALIVEDLLLRKALRLLRSEPRFRAGLL